MFAKCEAMGLAPIYHCRRLADYHVDQDGQAMAVDAANAFIAGECQVLVLRGTDKSPGYGTGKTTLAAAILYERLIKDGTIGLYTTVDRLLAEMRDAIDAKSGSTQRIKDHFIKAQLLVLDELLAEPMSSWAKKTISDIIAERMDYGRQTVIASNRSGKEIRGALHPRTYDRMQASVIGVTFDWKSERGAA